MDPNVLSILLLPILNWPVWSPVVFSVLIGLAALFV